MAIADGYYSIDRGGSGELRALIRVSDGGTTLERASADGWVADAELVRYWWNPGSDFVEPVDRPAAERLAAGLGLEL